MFYVMPYSRPKRIYPLQKYKKQNYYKIRKKKRNYSNDSSVIYLIFFRKERKFKNLIGLHSVRQLKKKTKNRKGGEEN